MCGIVGYIGHRNTTDVLLHGLRQLEYRGYEAAGIAIVDANNNVHVAKALKQVKGESATEALRQSIDETMSNARIGIGHTRWPTHGANTLENAHPHCDTNKIIWLAHNGTVDNFRDLERELSGHARRSQTDTELIAHCIADAWARHPDALLETAVREALDRISGTYALVVMSPRRPGRIVCARMGSSLSIGIGDNEVIIASDEAAIVSWTDRIIDLKDRDVITVTAQGIVGEERIPRRSVWNPEQAAKGGYAHFMRKEMCEQGETIRQALNHGGRLSHDDGDAILSGLEQHRSELQTVSELHLIACGTAYHAALGGQLMLSEWGNCRTTAHIGSEFHAHALRFERGINAVIAISQSGETHDTNAAVKEAKRRGALALGIVNRVGSELDRLCGAGVHCNAGPEISVASTKAYTSQLVVLALMTLFMGRQRGRTQQEGQQLVNALVALPVQAESIIRQYDAIDEIAKKCETFERFLFLGRKWHWPTALEGALKLKEITYRSAEGYPAGEMKHGPIALLDEHTPTIALMPRDETFTAMLGNLAEANRTGSPCIVITTPDGVDDVTPHARNVIVIPKTDRILQPILSVLPLQLFAYSLAVALNRDVDQPRNLAKSVTVG